MHKQIQNIAANYACIPWYALDRILQKLDTEEIKDLTNLFKKMYEQAQFAQIAYADGKEVGYDEGYSQGYDDGMEH